MKKRFASMLLVFVMVLSLVPCMGIAASAEEAVPYVYCTVSGNTVTKHNGICTDYEIVKEDTWDLEDGKWYVVTGDVNTVINVTGTANLILCNGATLSTDEQIQVISGNTLNIYAQAAGTGALVANNGSYLYAPIGGHMYESNCGTINIHGGVITATSSSNAAAIGGGLYSAGGIINIYNGTVTATANADYGAAGIGGGKNASGGQLNIYGGTVTATGFNAIGAGESGTSNGTLTLGDGVTFSAGESADNITVTGDMDNATEALGQKYFVTSYEAPESAYFLTSFTLNKNYNDAYDPSKHILGVNETLTFTIEPITENAPQFASNTVSLSVNDGKGSTDVDLPTVTAVGEYWYTITENAGHTAGATYNSNTFYLHLVTDYKDGEYGVVSAQIHTTAPDAYGTYKEDDKVTSISNSFAVGILDVTQETIVNGENNSDDALTAVITITLPKGTAIESNVVYGNQKWREIITPDKWTNGSITVSIDQKDGDTVIFEGLPDGATYTIKQDPNVSALGYDAAYTFNDPNEEGDSADSSGVKGMISDNFDIVTIHNEKNIPIDVGVMLENGAFVVLAVGALALGAWLVLSKRKERAYDAE